MTDIQLAKKLLADANKLTDFVTTVGLSQSIVLGGEEYVVTNCRAGDFSSKNKIRVMDILRDNMRALYEENGWGWKEVEKRKEVFDKLSRFITLCRADSPLEVVAYVIFRFVWDDDDEPEYPVLYCYELQVDKSMQKKGAGFALMKMLQQIAAHCQMRKTSLTVFKNNAAAMAFYKKAGFVVDSESPSQYGEDECYEILSDKNL